MIARKLYILLFLPALLLGQGGPNRPIPDDILFRSFFLRFSSREASAREKGVSEPAANRAIKDRAGLTDGEISLVKEVALSCSEAYNAKTQSGGEEVRQLAAQNPRKTTPPAAVVARIDALERERTKVVTDCMDRLKQGMGAARYAKLEAYVRQTASVRYIDPAHPQPNVKNILPPSQISTPAGGDPRQGGRQ